MSKNVFIVERKMILKPDEYRYLESRMDIIHRIYNVGVKHYRKVLKSFHSDILFINAFEKIQELYKIQKSTNKADTKTLESLNKQIKEQWNIVHNLAQNKYELKDGKVQDYLKATMQLSYKDSLYTHIPQALGKKLYKGIAECIVAPNRILHYRKRGQTTSFENKANGGGIFYNAEKDIVEFGFKNKIVKTILPNGKIKKSKTYQYQFSLKTIRQKDIYLKEAMLNKVKYCRIVRKPFGKQYRYFVQLVMEGKPPIKQRVKGKGTVGVDPGVSIVAYSNDKTARFVQLAEGIERYDKQIEVLSRQIERILRINNPDCYDENGVAIKGKKPTVRTKNYYDAIMELKTVYRKRSEFILLSHRTLANQIASIADTVITEPMDYKALQRKVKQTKRQENPSTITKKDGSVITIHKYKRKKRFGSSINRRAPATFFKILEDKIYSNGGKVIKVNCTKYKASQYNHITKEATKSLLSNRTKLIGTDLVQRDLYSSFLLYNIKDNENIDFDACNLNFNKFLELQQQVVEEIKTKGDTTKNFGLRDFIEFENKK